MHAYNLGSDMEILGLWIKGKVGRSRKMPPAFRTTDRKLLARRVLQDGGTACDTCEEHDDESNVFFSGKLALLVATI